MNIKKTTMPIIGAMMVMFAAAMWGADGILLRPKLYHLDVPIVVFLEHFIAFI
ncbi:EamA/RhaT family transporter, partial [Candidatus Woesearchaeota archaeon]|nr:EamA/RhaT family transporter [Candidatus Woesearchaeota archaeon]